MSVSHHGDDEYQKELMQRLLDQIDGTARRAYPAGRMGPEDEGQLALAITVDRQHGTVVIHFGKPVEWVGLKPDEVERFREMLLGALVGLQSGSPLSVTGKKEKPNVT